jgi:hypothetical protein
VHAVCTADAVVKGRGVSPAERRQRQLAPLKTGLYVKAESGLKLRHRKVRRLITKMHAAMPWLEPADQPACRAWAELEILGARAFAELETNGITNAAGEPRRLLGEFRQLRQAQLAYERDLGMTPAARMSLRLGDSRARTQDVVALLAEAASRPMAPRDEAASRPVGAVDLCSTDDARQVAGRLPPIMPQDAT